LPGFTSQTAFFPDLKYGLIICNNGDMPGYAATEAIFYRLVDKHLSVSLDDPERYDAVARFDKEFADKLEEYKNARSRVFPNITDPPLPLPLPLESLAGTYFHPGYGNMTLNVAGPARDIPVARGVSQVLHVDLDKEYTYTFDLSTSRVSVSWFG
jgi:hypothetical protein